MGILGEIFVDQLSGFVYLHKPSGGAVTALSTGGAATARPSGDTAPVVPSGGAPAAPDPMITEAASAPAVAPPLSDSNVLPTPAPRPIVGRLLIFWLEALAGRRTLKTLQRAPFTPLALADLERTIAREQGTLTASGIKSLHIQPGAGRRTRFCASVAFGTRVRAVVGTLSWRRLDPRMRKPQRTHAWHVEVIQII